MIAFYQCECRAFPDRLINVVFGNTVVLRVDLEMSVRVYKPVYCAGLYHGQAIEKRKCFGKLPFYFPFAFTVYITPFPSYFDRGQVCVSKRFTVFESWLDKYVSFVVAPPPFFIFLYPKGIPVGDESIAFDRPQSIAFGIDDLKQSRFGGPDNRMPFF